MLPSSNSYVVWTPTLVAQNSGQYTHLPPQRSALTQAWKETFAPAPNNSSTERYSQSRPDPPPTWFPVLAPPSSNPPPPSLHQMFQVAGMKNVDGGGRQGERGSRSSAEFQLLGTSQDSCTSNYSMQALVVDSSGHVSVATTSSGATRITSEFVFNIKQHIFGVSLVLQFCFCMKINHL